MKGVQWEPLCFLKNNPITNHTDSRVRLWNHSIPAGSMSLEVLSVRNRMGQSQCLFTSGPLGELWWGFVKSESHHHILHQPLTAAKRWLGLSMQGSTQLGSIPYIFLKKNLEYLGRGICMLCRRRDRGLLCLPSEQSPSTHSPPVSAGLAGQGTVPAPAKMWSWAKNLSLCLEKANGWLISANCLVTSLFLKAWCFQVW